MESFVECSANHEALSPVSFLKKAAGVHGGRISIIDYGNGNEERVYTWSQTYQRCLKLASALVQHFHLSTGDLVAAIAPNIPELYELHYAIPMAGAIISPLNTKLDSPTLSLLLHQLNPKLIFLHSQFLPLILQSLNQITIPTKPIIILIPSETKSEIPTTFLNYNQILEMGHEYNFTPKKIKESDPISVNYTSGSTGLHKGVVYSHRATYLNSLATIFRCRISRSPVFLWTVDMFRCNGWCFIWSVTALGGRNICLKTLTEKTIFDSILLHEVTILCGPPNILKIISDSGLRNPLPRRVDLIIAGAFPVNEILNRVSELGFNISYGYGMTEALGPAIIRPWNKSSPNYDYKKFKIFSEGFPFQNLITLEMDVKDPKTMTTVPEDGETVGEIMMRGNTLMMGYFRNPKATSEAFMGDWYRTRDVGIKHKGGFIEMKDRGADIMVRSGGEIVSTVEVEAVLMSHRKVVAAAAVGLGEILCGFVKVKNGCCVSVEEIVEFCGYYLPAFMVPERIVIGDLPVNSTGKVQKFVLWDKIKGTDLDI